MAFFFRSFKILLPQYIINLYNQGIFAFMPKGLFNNISKGLEFKGLIPKGAVVLIPKDGRGYHQSGMGTDKPGRPDIIQRHSKYIEQQKRKGKIPTGEIKLQPKWNQPYDELLKARVAKKG